MIATSEQGDEMTRSARWLAMVATTGMTFGLALWLARSVSFGWMPHAEADRWVVAAGFAAAMAAAVGAAIGWWAGREAPPVQPHGKQVSQQAKAFDRARVAQIGGNQNTGSVAARVAERGTGAVDQRAEAGGDAQVTQIGGDQISGGPSGPAARP